jgi:hypothetical protein
MAQPPAFRGLAKIQHYVPKCLLRGFAAGKSDKIWVCDKQTSRSPFLTAVKNVAAEQGFYNLALPTGVATLEPFLGRLEDRAAGILVRVRREQSIGWLNEEQRMLLAMFAAVQMQRTNSFRLKLADMMEQLSARMRQMGAAFGIAEHHLDERMPGARKATDEDTKRLMLSMTADAAKLAPLLFEKSLILVRAPKGARFYLSDNPVTLHNMEDYGFRGNIGLAVRGIQLYLPISSDLMLWWVCTSYEELFRRNLAQIQGDWPRLSDDERARLKPLIDGNHRYLTAIAGGAPLQFDDQNMLHANSMQVIYAERFVFSSTDDFSLAREMVRNDARLTHGPRGEVH